MTLNLVRSTSAASRRCSCRTDWLLATPFGVIVLVALALFSSPRTAQGAEASLLSHGNFEPDQATTVVEMPTTYVVGTQNTDIWYTRLGTGTQQVSYQDDGAGNHFVSVGTSVNQPGIFQVVPWPGEGTAQLSYSYSGPRAIVRVFGAETGDTIAKFSGVNSLTLIQQIDNPAATDWTTVTHEVELSGVYDYLVVRFGTAGTAPSLYDNIAMTAPVKAPDIAPVIVTESLPATQVGAAYVATLEAEGGNGALTWSVVAGTLPAGLTLSDDGFISGVPTTAGASSFTVRVVDGDDNVAETDASTREYSIVVNVPVPPTASLVVTRTSGVAPLAVSFDATGSTSLLTSRPFHDLHYHWNYGDPNSGVWSTSRKSKNEDLGAIGGHVYETPGVYTATLTVTDDTGASSQATVEITVEDPDVVFAGANTICISTDGDFTGAPAGSLHVTSDSWATIASSLGTGKRVLLKRGNTWVSDGTRITMNFAGPGILGAFGTGPKPIITFAADGTGWTFFMGNGNTPYQFGDFRFMDFEIQGRGFNYSGFHAEGAFNNLTILRVDASEMGVFLNLSPPILRYYNNDDRPGHQLWEGVAVVDTKYEKVVGDGGEFNGRHIAYAGMARSLFMGNIWNNAEQGEHILRVPFARRFIVAHNELTNARLTKHLIKMHGGGTEDVEGQWVPPGENQTRYVTISDNYFSSRLGDWFVSVGPQNPSSAEVTLDVIVERNHAVFGGDSNVAFHMAASSTTVRNNTVIMTGASTGGTIAAIDRRGIEPTPVDNQVYNNSAYSGNTQSFTLVSVVASATDTVVRNNLGRALGSSKTLISGGGTNLVQSNNVITDTPGWVVADPTAAHHFDLVSGSEAIGAGYPVPLLADFEGQPRWPSGGISLGAFESPPTTPNVAPAIVTTVLRGGAYGESYWVTLEGEGGNGRLYWTVASGNLPEGLELRANGQIVGKPTSSGSFTFTVNLEDSDGAIGGSDAAVRAFTLDIAAEPNSVPRITAANVPAAIVGESYSRTLTAIDGNGALTWTLTSGALPPGFSLSAQGVISGTATATGEFSFTVSVADSDDEVGAADEDTATYTLVINPAGSVTGYQGPTFYNQSFAAQAGQFEATFDVYVPSKPINAPIGLSFGPANSYAQMAAIVGFSAEGYLNARDGGAYTYTAPAIVYEAGMTLGYRLVVDIPAKKYSVYVSVDGGEEQLLADNFNFRTEQASVAALNNLSVKVDAPVGGWVSVTNFAVTPIGEPGVPVTGISVAPASVELEIGETAVLTAAVAPSNATNQVVSWSSSAPTVASVDQNGNVTAISAGSATITATTLEGGFTASSAVTVAGTSGEVSVMIFADAGVHDFGGAAGALDTEVFRSGTASWRITYNSDSATSAFNPQGATLKMSDLTPYANSGYFEFWYRSTKAGTMRFQVMDGGAANVTIFQADRALVATTEWTRVEIPFTGWTQAPSTTANWKLMLRGWIGMNGATVHYDDIRFVGTTPGTVAVTGVTVTPTTLALEVGESSTLTANVAPLNATNTAVSWTTSNAAVATVSSSGVVTAVAEGSATITATTADGGFTATSAVTVTAAAEPGLDVSIYSDSATADVGVPSVGASDTSIFRSGTASWRITYADDWSVSIFHPQGAESTMADLTPYANSGYFEFWYRSSKAGSVQLRVLDAGAANANLFQADIPLAATEVWTRVEIPFTGWTQAPSSSANWRLMLRGWGGIGGGTVHYDDIKFIGEDVASAPVTGVGVAPTSLELEVGETSTLTATVTPANASNPAVSWTTSNAAVATVSSSGVVTAVGAGSATITATTEDGGFTATSAVTVSAAQTNELELAIFSDAGTHAFGGVTGALDTEVRRSGTASWRITYADDWSTSAFNPLGATMSPAALTPYANSGYFEFWYRSSKAGTIRFQVLDVGAVNAALFTADRAVAATTEWTRIEIPFTGWTQAPSSNTNWRLMLRGYGGMAGATVHYDDIRFVVPGAVGEVPATGVSVSPSATSLEVGQTQQLTVTVAPPNATNQDVTWASSDPSVASVDASGVVTAVAVGTATITVTTDDGGHTAESTITVVAAEPGRHPFLFFSAKDIPTIRARMDAPEVADRRTRLINRANALLGASPATDSRTMQGNSGILAFAYIVTGNEAYAQRAIQEALATADLPTWITGHDFNRGADLVSSERSLGTALVYDWCYDVMTPGQRSTLRNALLEKGVAQYNLTVDPTLSPNWYTFEPVNNWRGVCHGGNAVAALVLYYESEEARRAADLANQHLPPTLRSLVLEDSGGHEGNTYNNYGVEYALKGAMAMQRFYGGYEELLEEFAVEKLGNYWSVYLFGPDHRFANISRHNYDWAAGLYSAGGGVEGGPSSQRSTLVDSLVPGGDQLMRWAADNGSQRFYWSGASPFYFLWRRIGAPTTFQQPKPELQDAVLFRGAGHGIFQSDTLWMAYSGGATHNRGDGGAFVLVAKNGQNWERLIHLEPSLNFFESENHSTYLINGVGQRRGLDTLVNRAQYERFGSGEGFHYAASNIKPLYANTALTKLTRHLVMVRGKYVVLLDDLAGSEPLNFEARFQTAETNTITVNTEGGKVVGQNLDLHIVSSGFDPFATGQGQGASTAVRHLRFSRQAEEAALLTVLYPTARGGAAPTVQVTDGVVTITHGGETDQVTFIREGQNWRLSAVNGATADNIPTGEERNIVPYREGRDDTDEVPVWMMETVGEPIVIPDTGVTVSHGQVSLNVGQTQAITATVAPANATNGSVVWTTSNPAIARVTQTSLSAATVRAVGVGTATITATSSGGFTAHTVVTVNSTGELIVPYASTAPALDGIIDSSYGGVLGVIAKPAPGETTPAPSNISASWRAAFTSSDLHIVVDVTDDAWITTEANEWHNDCVELFLDGNNSKNSTSDGLNDIKVAFVPQPNGTVQVQTVVYPPNPAGLDLSGVQAAFTLKSGGGENYSGYVLEIKVPLAALGTVAEEGRKIGIDFQLDDNDSPGPRDRYLTWFGSNLNNNPAAYGTITLGAIDGGGGTEVPVTGVSVSPDEVTLEVGQTEQLAATIEPIDADNTNVTWSTSNAAIVTVDETGLVTAIAPGEATITVTTEDGDFTATSVVTVVLLPGSVPEITTTALPAGEVGVPYSQQLAATGGDGELVWSLASGSLPGGLNLSATGLISGTPTAAGASNVVVRVADSDAFEGAEDEDTQAFTLTIAVPPPTEVTVTLSNLEQRYDGLPKPVTVTTAPNNVDVTITYDGSEEPPVYPGIYDVVATVTESGYVGSATAQLEIGITALVRHGVTMSGEIDGSLQVLLPESTTWNGGAWISGDLLVSGRPGVTVNGNAAYVAVIEANGSATPTQHRVTLNSNTVVRYVVRQVDAIALPTVAAPPAPSGTRNVAINQAGQSIGDPATLRNLTINSKGGEVAVPPGTYGEFVANGQTAFVLGVAGAETPVVYNLQKLTLNSKSQLKIVGPVVLNVRETVMFNSANAAAHDPAWLTVRVHNGGLTLNGDSDLNGDVVTPTGTVTLNGSSVLQGSVTADRLTINKQAALRDPEL